jgi:riboflavin kinase/FMN adenylyltransferase
MGTGNLPSVAIVSIDDFIAAPSGSAVTVGTFDGVHLGHQALIRALLEEAARRGLEAVALTFDRHPAAVLRPEAAPPLLTDLEQKLELLAATGVAHVAVLRFDDARAQCPPEVFVDEVLVGRLAARLVVVGGNFRFGRERAGDVALLERLGRARGFEVEGVALRADSLGPVSSTRIRQALLAGRVEEAASLLGRPFELAGTVVRGEQRGRKLGYPTANVQPSPGVLVPREGIYAGRVRREDGSVHDAAVSVGRKPTFRAAGPVVVEAYLIDFDGDLYGERVRVCFEARLRDEARFDSAAELVDRMAADVARARDVLRRASSGQVAGREAGSGLATESHGADGTARLTSGGEAVLLQ